MDFLASLSLSGLDTVNTRTLANGVCFGAFRVGWGGRRGKSSAIAVTGRFGERCNTNAADVPISIIQRGLDHRRLMVPADRAMSGLRATGDSQASGERTNKRGKTECRKVRASQDGPLRSRGLPKSELTDERRK